MFRRRLGLALFVWLVMDYSDASSPGAFFFEAEGFYVEGVLGARGAVMSAVPPPAPTPARVEPTVVDVRPAARVGLVPFPARAPSHATTVARRLPAAPEAPAEDH